MTINWNKPLEFYCNASESWLPARVISSDFRLALREDASHMIQIEYSNRSAYQIINKNGQTEYDGISRLRNKPVIVERWMNVYKYRVGDTYAGGGTLHPSEEGARIEGKGDCNYLTTIKVTFEDTGA
jgi:hypothetical protein